MSVNVGSFELAVAQKLNEATTTQDILMYTKALAQLKNEIIFTAATTFELVNYEFNEGVLVFVVSEKTLYVFFNGLWKPLIDTTYSVLWGWGENWLGQSGNTDLSNKSSPTSVAGGFSDWRKVSVGGNHSLGLRSNGTLWSWGFNWATLADGTSATRRSSPVQVVGGFTDWQNIAAGDGHSSGIRCNGTMWAWGANNVGQLGDGTIVQRSSPVSVVGGFTDWIQTSRGGQHTVAITSASTIWTWGANQAGQLGTCSPCSASRSSPVSVIGGLAGWCQTSAGGFSTAAVRMNGTLWTWGDNNCGQLGDGTGGAGTNKSSPVSVLGGFTDWCQVSIGDRNTAAIRRASTTLWTWGDNSEGNLGDGTVINRSSPVQVAGFWAINCNWCQAATGFRSTVGLKTDGTVWAMGHQYAGQLGNNIDSIQGISSPISVIGNFTDWCHVSACNRTVIGIRYNSI